MLPRQERQPAQRHARPRATTWRDRHKRCARSRKRNRSTIFRISTPRLCSAMPSSTSCRRRSLRPPIAGRRRAHRRADAGALFCATGDFRQDGGPEHRRRIRSVRTGRQCAARAHRRLDAAAREPSPQDGCSLKQPGRSLNPSGRGAPPAFAPAAFSGRRSSRTGYRLARTCDNRARRKARRASASRRARRAASVRQIVS